MENVLEKDITGHIGTKYLCTITWRNQLIMDEPDIDGKDLGPDPFLHS
jgi:hypothetical protein